MHRHGCAERCYCVGNPGVPNGRPGKLPPLSKSPLAIEDTIDGQYADIAMRVNGSAISGEIPLLAMLVRDATTVTVKSADGFTLTWTFGDPVKVVKDRAKAAPSALTVGATVGVAGERTGGTTTARLVVVPGAK